MLDIELQSPFFFFFSRRRRLTRCALVTGVQTCALPISTRRSLRFSACPALSPVCFLGPATAAPKGMERWGRASLPPTRSDPVLVGPGFFVGRATARHFNAPAHQSGSDFSQENNELDQRSEEHTSELQSLMRISYA